MAKSQFTDEDDALLSELGVEVESKEYSRHTPREERIVAGFEEIQRFVERHGRLPRHEEGRDIFERLYAVRLDRMRHLEECRTLLRELDRRGLLGNGDEAREPETPEIDDDELLAQLGVGTPRKGDVDYLEHVKPRAEVRAAEEIASRIPCPDFAKFRPLFEAVQRDLESGLRQTQPFRDYAEIRAGDFFILSGQKVYVAEVGEYFRTEFERKDSRLRVIYDNGTESDILMRSLQRALNKDPAGRRTVERQLAAGPLFAGKRDEEDASCGTIYVLRSNSKLPYIIENRDVIHKIGVTGGDVERRVAQASLDPTFLMAEVEIMATYDLVGIDRTRLENLLHRFFAAARLEIEIEDRFGRPVIPEEWFLVPLHVIDEVVQKIRAGTIDQYVYDVGTASLVRG